MPDDVGGQPFPDGEEPEYRHQRADADEEFASVVFDDDFVRAAGIHEPTAAERLRAAASSPAENHGGSGGTEGGAAEDADADSRFGHPDHLGHRGNGEFGAGRGARVEGLPPWQTGDAADFEHGADYGYPIGGEAEEDRPYRGHVRWQRPVAWVLALVMGLGVVALAFSAVYRGSSGQRPEPSPPPTTSGVDSQEEQGLGGPVRPSTPVDAGTPVVPGAP
ncbi:hypothetical protein [Streptomyces sp. AJS327]|uniref:SCO2584 family spore wall biosynthesis protein n=1 Tax=Streptomyces sp. AJS327 TaxID=2545265 RepID=UPI0015DD68D6|nr:hypothetical protein [Streptomyces sp. AJS327]